MIPGSIHPLLAGATTYLVQNSLRFKSASSGLLARTIGSSSTSTTTCTLSFWIKRGAFGSGRQTIFYTGNSSGTLNMIMIEFTSSQQLLAYYNGAGSTGFTTSAVFRDPSAWYHIVHAYDSTQATDSNRIKLYINGNQNSSFSSINYPTLNQAFSAGATDIQRMMGFITTQFVDGYLAESHFVDGQALTPSSFGETDNVTGVWVPKKYTGTYGTNGFYLEFKDASAATNTAIGKDSSGNGNHFTPSGVSVTSGNTFDQMVDTPTLNYATWSPIDTRGSAIPTAGNLNPGVGNSQGVRATIGVTSGKWYWEHRLATASTDYTAGITNQEPLGTYLGFDTNSIGYAATGTVLRNASVIATYGNWNTSGKIVAFALDQDNKTIQMFVDGVSQNAAFAHLLTGTIFPAINFGTGYGTPVGITNFGQQPFTYTPPTGFKALNSSNFSVPTILKSSSYFDAITYTGNETSQNLTNLSFQSDLIWIKRRDSSTNGDHLIVDTSRTSGLTQSNTFVSNTITNWVGDTANWTFGYIDGDGLRGGRSGVNARTNMYLDLDIDANTAFEIEYKIRGTDPLTSANAAGGVAIYRKQDQGNVGVTAATNYYALGMFSSSSTHWVNSVDPANTIGVCVMHSAASADVVEEKGANTVTLTSNVASSNVFFLSRESDGNLKVYRTNSTGDRILLKTHPEKTNSIMRLAVTSTAEGNFLNLEYVKINLIGASSTTTRYPTLYTNLTTTEFIEDEFISFNNNGFSIASSNGNTIGPTGKRVTRYNINAATYASYAWKKTPSAGFDIVTYGGTGSAQTLSHNLGVAPSMMIVKNRTGLDRRWTVYHKSIPNSETGGVYLDLINAWNSDSTLFNSTAPTSSQFTVGSYYSVTGETYVTYLWSEVANFSKFGSYLGNGSTDGPFVWCGFRPKWVMIKAYNLGTYFMIWSSYNNNEVVSRLIPTLTNSEASNVYGIDILSNGFKVRAPTGYSLNNTGYTYIFAAFSETPFKYARAR